MPGRHRRVDALLRQPRIARSAQALTGALIVAAGAGLVTLAPPAGPTQPRSTPVAWANPVPPRPAPSAAVPPSPTPVASTTAPARRLGARVTRPGSRPPSPTGAAGPLADVSDGPTDIPITALSAYRRAARTADRADPGCHIRWQYLAAIGQIETDHGRFGGARFTADGTVTPAIYGPPIPWLLGPDARPIRAAGPMQFIPSTWRMWGRGNVQNINDAALAAAEYLCASGRDLSTRAGRVVATFSYNHAKWYVADVEAGYQAYLKGTYLTTYPVPAPTPTTSPSPTRTATTRPGAGAVPSGTPRARTSAPVTPRPTPGPRASPSQPPGTSDATPGPAQSGSAPSGSAPSGSAPSGSAPSGAPSTAPAGFPGFA